MRPLRTELSVLVRLAWPVSVAQIGAMMLGVVDTWMVAQLGARELAATALADVCMFGSMIVGIGLVMGIDPIVAQSHGAGDGPRAGRALQRGLVVSVLAGLPIIAVWWWTEPLLLAFGQGDDASALASVYARVQVFSIVPFLAFTTMRQYLQGRGIMLPALWIVLVGNVFNVLANWVLVFGNWGAPPLGVLGAGLATGFTRVFMAAAMVWVLFGRGLHRGAWDPWTARCLRPDGLLHVLRYGVPIAIQFALEVWAFSATTVFAGWIGRDAVAAHIAVLRCAALAFMVPLGISVASAARVGHLIGARDPAGAQRAAWVALGLGTAVMAVSAVVFIVFRHGLAALFTDSAGIAALSASIFPIAAAFQLFDGTQVVGGGILRGMGTPRPAAVINLVGFYALAFPLALLLKDRIGLAGIWWGLCLGLAATAVFFVVWIARRGPARAAELA